MNWILEIEKFPQLKLNTGSSFATSKEINNVIQKYDKALNNALNDSVDIAIIELRKLSVLYPDSGQIKVLLGACQMMEGRYKEALLNFEKASTTDLPKGMSVQVNTYTEEAKGLIADYQQQKHASVPTSKTIPIPQIIEATPTRRKKRKMATNKEKKEIATFMSSGGEVRETFVNEGRNINWIKILLGIAITAAIISVLIFAVIYLPDVINASREKRSNNAEKLDWILTKLEDEKEDPKIKDILKEYDIKFYPPVTIPISSNSSILPTPTQAQTSPSPSPKPTTGDIIIKAYENIKKAEEIGREDPTKVMTIIMEVVNKLEGIDENTTTEDLQVNVGDILQKAYQLEKSVVNSACYPYYKEGKSKLDNKQYLAAAEAFKKAYDINPNYLDGGNTYNLAKAYASAGQRQKANEYFQYIIDTFPESDYATWSSSRIVPIITDGE